MSQLTLPPIIAQEKVEACRVPEPQIESLQKDQASRGSVLIMPERRLSEQNCSNNEMDLHSSLGTTQLTDLEHDEDDETESCRTVCRRALRNCLRMIFSTGPRYDDFTFRQGRVVQDKNRPNVFYFHVRRKHDKLPQKVFSDFSNYFNGHIKDIHPYNRKNRQD